MICRCVCVCLSMYLCVYPRVRPPHLVQFDGGLGRLAGAAVVPVGRPAGAVPATALDQQAAGEEDSVGGAQLLAQVHRQVARRAAVAPDVVVETVQVHWRGGGGDMEEREVREDECNHRRPDLSTTVGGGFLCGSVEDQRGGGGDDWGET